MWAVYRNNVCLTSDARINIIMPGDPRAKSVRDYINDVGADNIDLSKAEVL